MRRRASDPAEQLLAIFDVFDEWFRTPGFEGCSFINVMLEHPGFDHALHRAAASYLQRIRDFIEDLGRRAGVAEAEGFAREWHILMKGSIVAAGEGDQIAATRAKKIATLLLQHARHEPEGHRPAPSA